MIVNWWHAHSSLFERGVCILKTHGVEVLVDFLLNPGINDVHYFAKC